MSLDGPTSAGNVLLAEIEGLLWGAGRGMALATDDSWEEFYADHADEIVELGKHIDETDLFDDDELVAYIRRGFTSRNGGDDE